jgi:L-histidine N-alpha-methyltransferase
MSAEEDVREGLSAKQKHLPAYLFYDERGGQLFTQITTLPEYYLTRAEREIFTTQQDEIAELLTADAKQLSVLELGAGSAEKSQILLKALAKRCALTFYPVDVDSAALQVCCTNLAQQPSLRVSPMVMQNQEALSVFQRVSGPKAIFFIGSSIGNLSDDEARSLLQSVRASLGSGGFLLLGADQTKDIQTLLRAYDDAQGVTAQFNLNILSHINQRFGANFDLSRFAHRAIWNESARAIEMHLVSQQTQQVDLTTLGFSIRLQAGETIHTESCAKYDERRITHLLSSAGLTRHATLQDTKKQFAVYLARA